ncbi:MAG: hypothetical protein Q4E91_13360, partial [Lachnospiraceae bacterium]|nr:hypothetical protein [Lachnospiraceae bacterium]
MDERSVLKAGRVLPFPGMECEIDSVVGRGANAVVYLGHYQDQQNKQLSHQVLIKELFPYEPKGLIYRDEQDRICVKPEAADTMELHRLSFLRGNEIHIRLLGQHPGEIDSNINTFEWNHTLYTILGFSGGRSLDRELQSGKTAVLEEQIRRIRGALEVLGAFHASGYLHLDISPDNILLLGEGKRERVTLIDYNSVHTLEEIREEKSVYYSAKEGYTAPEIRAGRRAEIGFGTDLYAMTATFYTCLTGKRLSAMQIVRSTVPDISGAECLRDCPSTVISMVRTILKKGLAAIPRRRYQSAEEMLTDLEELKDRIDGKGITHWALWETGRANVRKAVNSNTALRYIGEEEKVYPLRGTLESGERVSLMDMSFVYQQRDDRPLLLLGSGGMGKTTALLRMAYHQKREYAPAEPAITYISLFGWNESGETYIRDRILENLRFKEQTDSMETARHELKRVLSEPLHTKNGDRPVLLLLLDGLNEASGNIAPLQKEIHELSGLGGVRVILTSRSESTGLDYRRIVLERLKREDVKKALAGQGLLAPENMELLELLHVPMLLSMFIDTALAKEKQLQISTKEELLRGYLSAIMEKEIRALPEEAPERWGIQAAVNYVLPEAAALIQKREEAVSDDELLKLIEECYKELRKKPLTAVFPEWIGHSSDMKMGAENADVWYGKIVLEILWKRLGMIVRDEQGNFRILHQILEEYLAGRSAEFHREFDRQKKIQRNWKRLIASGTIAGFVLVLSISFAMYNSYMANKISESNRQILTNESKNLAYLSGLELENGNSTSAIETAVSALPSGDKERPYVAEAEKALSDAAGIYQYPHYLITDEIFIGTNVKKLEYSANGDCIVIMNDSDVVSCIDGKNGNNLWSRRLNEPYGYVDMDIIDDLDAVLLAGYNGSELLSLASGETVWEISFEERADAYSSEVSLIVSNKQHIVLEFEACDVHGTCTSLQYLVFETQTGALISKTEDLLEKEIYQDYIAAQDTAAMKQTSYGDILDHNICFAAAEFGMMGSRDYWLIWFDIESGELIEYSVCQTDESICLSEKDWLELYQGEIFSPEGKSLGTLTCIRDRGSFSGPQSISFQAEEEERLNFELLLDSDLLLGSDPAYAFSDEAHMVLVYGNKIYGFGYGENTERITYEKEIVHCIEAVEGHTLCLFFSDGSIQYFNTKDFAKGDIRLNGRLIEKKIEAVEYRSENDALFYVMDSDNEGILYRCEKIEDTNSRYTELPGGLFEEDT